MADHPVSVAAICVYHAFISRCAAALTGSGIRVAAVSTGFPAGQSPYGLRLAEIGESIRAGAEEIDIVISRRHVLAGDWEALYDEVREVGPAHAHRLENLQRRPVNSPDLAGGERRMGDLIRVAPAMDRSARRNSHSIPSGVR